MSQISIDLTTLSGWDDLSDGTYHITVGAKASGYTRVIQSQAVSVTKTTVITYTITNSITNGVAAGDVTIVTDGNATVTIIPNTNYGLPNSVTVTGATYSYNDSTGVISLSNPVDNVTITATCPAVQPSSSPIYGVEWTNDTSITMTRTDDATNMTYAISSGRVASDFDNVFPYNQMKRTTIDGNTFVYVPSMWIRIKEGNSYTGTNYFDITGVAVSESQGPAQAGYSWYQTNAFYYGAYGASSDGTTLSSVTGATRVGSITRAVARQRATSVGTGYHQRDLYQGTILMFLWWIEFATKNSQSVMTGVNGGTKQSTGGTDSFYNETAGTGFCVSGYNTTNNQMVWHGIEDYVGNQFEWEDGITGDGSSGGAQYVSDDYTEYDDYNSGSNMSVLAFNAPTTTGNCLIALGWDSTNPFLIQPIATTSDSNYTSGFCDYASTTNRAVSGRGARYGGSAGVGVSCFDRYNVANAFGNIGARLSKTA